MPSTSIASVLEELVVSEGIGESSLVGMPRAEVDLVVRFGSAAMDGVDVYALGARERVHRKTVRGVRQTLIARLRLGAAQTVLGVPASQIAGRIVALDELWGQAAARLRSRLAGARDALEAAAIFDAALVERVARASAPHRGGSLALHAAHKLRDESPAHGNVSSVADDLGVSERHLRRVFREAFGVAPKTFAKLARFNRALSAARRGRQARWASIAADAGYYDQAHLIAEFKAIAGTTPRALLGELRGSGSVP